MSVLKAERAALATALGEALEVTVYGTVPEAIEPPCLIVQAGEPWLAPGDTFAGDVAVTFDLVLVADLLTNAQAIEDLEDLLPPVLEALEATDYGLDTVNRPGPVHTADWLAHGVTVTVSRFITL